MSGGRPWTEVEQAQLQRAVRSGDDLANLAVALGRTRDALYRRAVATGLIQPVQRTPRRSRRGYHELFGD